MTPNRRAVLHAVARGLLLLPLLLAGCKREAPAPATPAEPAVRDGLTRDWRTLNSECASGRRVEKPQPGSADEVLWQVYGAALAADDDASFARFYALLDSDRYTEDWAKTQFWSRLRSHVTKYVAAPDNPSFIVCREEKKSEDQIKIFVFSSDPKKSHTPYGLKKIDGAWRIEFFTP